MKQSEYNALKAKIEELQAELDKAVVEKKKFEAKGDWTIFGDGDIEQMVYIEEYKEYFNVWQTKEQAEQASIYQYNQNLIMNYVTQFEGYIGKGRCFIYKNSIEHWHYNYLSSSHYCPGVITMTKGCAKALIQDINDGVVVFKEIKWK